MTPATVATAAVVLEQPAAGISVLRLNRPAALNALTLPMVADICRALDQVALDPACRVLILAGSGRAFCAGMDIKANSDQPGDAAGVVAKMALQEQFASMTKRLRRLPQPVLAAIQGPVAGAGFALALAADIRVASHSAKFLIAAIRLGLTAGETGISYHLPRLIGASRAFEIMLSGRPLLAAEAAHCGLVADVVDDADLFARTLQLAETLLANSPFAIKHTKQLMWANLDAQSLDAALELENHMQVVASLTDDFAEASAAFIERRAPHFRGR
jgi:enoyl-CoA hydratase